MADLIVGYDGSPNAQQAIDLVARLVGRGSHVVAVTAWHLPAAAIHTPSPPVGAPAPPSMEEQRELESRARHTAEEGASRARAAGLEAESHTQQAIGTTDIARTLFDVADEHDAALVVVGRRGMSRIKSALLGSVSNAAVGDGRRPVLVVPASED